MTKIREKYLEQLALFDIKDNHNYIEHFLKNAEENEAEIKEYLKNNTLNLEGVYIGFGVFPLEFLVKEVFVENNEIYFNGSVIIKNEKGRITFKMDKELLGMVAVTNVIFIVRGMEYLKGLTADSKEEFTDWLKKTFGEEINTHIYFLSQATRMKHQVFYEPFKKALKKYYDIEIKIGIPLDEIRYALADPIEIIVDPEENKKIIQKIQKKISSLIKKQPSVDFVALDSCMNFFDYSPRGRDKKFFYKEEQIGFFGKQRRFMLRYT